MTPEYTSHEKISLRKHPTLNERWLHDRIADNPAILGLGDVRVLDQERTVPGGGRIDLVLLDEDNNRRYEVEIQLGATDPSHIIRCIEYWDLERRRYPGYDHVAVLVAEDVTSRFLNVMGLLAGSIPLIAIRLSAMTVGNYLLLDFVQVLDQTELRLDDTKEDTGGGQADRGYWNDKVGKELMKLCDSTLELINGAASTAWQLNYLRGYVGLQSGGVVNNFIHMAPKKTKDFVHIMLRTSNALQWAEKISAEGIPAVCRHSGHLRISVKPDQFKKHGDIIKEVISETVVEFES